MYVQWTCLCSSVFDGVLAVIIVVSCRNNLWPEPMWPPHTVHLFNWDSLGLRQKQCNKDGHDDHKPSKEEEESKFQVAEHGEENLSNGEGEQHVNSNIEGLTCRSNLERADFTRHQPSQWTPWPGKGCNICTNEEQEKVGFSLGEWSFTTHSKLQSNHGSNSNLQTIILTFKLVMLYIV